MLSQGLANFAKSMLWLSLSIIFICLCALSLFADQVRLNPRPRLLSMGGAGIASDGDKDSAMVNPAGLADIKGFHYEAFPLMAEIGISDIGRAQDTVDLVNNLKRDGNTDKQSQLQEYVDKNSDSAMLARLNLYPSFTMPYFHVGLLGDFLMQPQMQIGGALANELASFKNSSTTAGLIIGGAYQILEKRLQFGVTVKPIYRTRFTQHQDLRMLDVVQGLNPAASVEDQIKATSPGLKGAMAVGVDAGVKMILPYGEAYFKPEIGITYQDIGNTRFLTDEPLPQNIPQSVSLGVAIHPQTILSRNTIALDIRGLNEDSPFINKIHFGAESMLFSMLALRAGVSQGYFTGGIGLFFKFFEMEGFITSREIAEHAHFKGLYTYGLRIASTF